MLCEADGVRWNRGGAFAEQGGVMQSGAALCRVGRIGAGECCAR